MTNKQIGARIESLRRAGGLSQSGLAEKMGYKSDTTISKWESGANIPNGGKLVELAQILGTTTDYILFGGSTIVTGDNNGMAGDNHGSVTINNAKDSKDAGRQKEMAANSAKDIDLQTEILAHIDAQTEIQKSIDEKLSILIELLKNKG